MSCFDKIFDQIKSDPKNGGLSDAQIREKALKATRAINEELTKISEDPRNATPDEILKASKEAMTREEINLLKKEKDAVTNILRKQAFDEFAKKPEFKGSPIEILTGYLRSAEVRIAQYKNRIISRFLGELEGLGKDVVNNYVKMNYERELALELDNLARSDTKKASVSGNKEAFEVAKIVNKHLKSALELENNAGATKFDLQGFISKNIHNQTSIRYAGWGDELGGYWDAIKRGRLPTENEHFQVWRDFVMQNGILDHVKTWGARSQKEMDTAVEKSLRQIWNDLASGKHTIDIGTDAYGKPKTFDGGGDISKGINASRILHFTPEGFVKYNKRFGSGSLANSIDATLASAAKNAGLLEHFGTMPEDFLVRRRDELLKNASVSEREKLNGRKIQGLYDIISGRVNIPAKIMRAKILQEIRAGVGAAKLPFSSLRSMTDLANATTHLNTVMGDEFKAPLSAYAAIAEELVANNREVSHSLGNTADELRHTVLGRHYSENNSPGAMSKALNWLMKRTGQNWWDEHLPDAHSKVLASKMADNANLSFKDFTEKFPDIKASFEHHGITPADWEAMAKFGKQHIAERGKDYLLPEHIHDMTDADAIKYMKQNGEKVFSDSAIKRYKNNLENKFQDYFTEQATYVIPRQQAAQKYYTTGEGRPAGTFIGDLARTVSHFKGTTLTVGMHIAPRFGKGLLPNGIGGLLRGEVNGSKAMNMASFIVGTTALYVLSKTLIDTAKGLTPEFAPKNFQKDPIKMTAKAFAGGGAASFYGDYLLGEYGANGKSLSGAILGPDFGLIEELARIKTKAQNGGDITPNTLKFIENNSPYINFPVLRTSFDYLIMYHLQEKLNPGYLKRMEAYRRKNMGQEAIFGLEPSKYAVGQ